MTKEIKTNIACPFCGGKIFKLPSGLEIKNIIKITKEIVKRAKGDNN